jgi:hypothetical protein
MDRHVDIHELSRARHLASSGLGRLARLGAHLALADVQAELRRQGYGVSLPQLSRIERGLRRANGPMGVAWGRLMDELLKGGASA